MSRMALLFLLLLFPLAFPAYTGQMVAFVEKEWTIESNGTIRDVALNGSFLLETPYQRVLQVNVSEGEIIHSGDELRIIYRASILNLTKKVTATATVETQYLPSIMQNPPLPAGPLPTSLNANYTEEMLNFSRVYASESEGQLDAAVLLASWVYRNIHYNPEYWGSASPAPEVYSSREAVCVGYTHLLIALARSLGIESRYISGYIFSDGWQEHAWAEFRIGDTWVPADPTFNEFGYLDARHVAKGHSADQSGTADRLVAKGDHFSLSSTIHIRMSESRPFPLIASAYAAYDGVEFDVIISNPGDSYITPTYKVSFPEYVHSTESGILMVPPRGRHVLQYSLDTSSFGSDAVYTVPYILSMQGTEISDSITVSRNGAPPPRESAACPVAAILVFTFFLTIARLRR